VAVVGAKGGVGATTFTLNLATILSQQKHSVIAAELHPSYGTFSMALKHSAGKNLSNILQIDASQISERDINACLFSTQFGPRVLFGPQAPDAYAEIVPAQMEAIVQRLSYMADYVVVDFPAQPSDAIQAATPLINYFLIPVEPEPASMACGRVAVQRLQSWNVPDSMIAAVIVNRVALAMPLSLTDVRTQLGCNVLGVFPGAADACVAAHGRGLPLVAFKPDQIAVDNLVGIATRVAEILEGTLKQ
jgi:MinD-like ATPase involved in chromosome partitioning or flagellar assembly